MFLFTSILNCFKGSNKKTALQSMQDEKAKLEEKLKALEEIKARLKTFIESK